MQKLVCKDYTVASRDLIPTPRITSCPLSLVVIPEPCAEISISIIPHNPKVQTKFRCTHVTPWCYLNSPMRHAPFPLFV